MYPSNFTWKPSKDVLPSEHVFHSSAAKGSHLWLPFSTRQGRSRGGQISPGWDVLRKAPRRLWLLLRTSLGPQGKQWWQWTTPSYFPWNPGCLIGILIMVCCNPYTTLYNWVVFHPLHTLNNEGFFHCSHDLTDGKLLVWGTKRGALWGHHKHKVGPLSVISSLITPSTHRGYGNHKIYRVCKEQFLFSLLGNFVQVRFLAMKKNSHLHYRSEIPLKLSLIPPEMGPISWPYRNYRMEVMLNC